MPISRCCCPQRYSSLLMAMNCQSRYRECPDWFQKGPKKNTKVDGARSPEIPQKEGVSGPEIAAQSRTSLATSITPLNRNAALLCLASEITSEGVRDGHRNSQKNRCDFGVLRAKTMTLQPMLVWKKQRKPLEKSKGSTLCGTHKIHGEERKYTRKWSQEESKTKSKGWRIREAFKATLENGKSLGELSSCILRDTTEPWQLPLERKLLHIRFWREIKSCQSAGLHYST